MIRGGSAALILTLGLMLVTRDQVRTAALEAAGYTPAAWVAPQWGLMLIFAVLLVAALALTGGMLAALARGGRARGRQAAQGPPGRSDPGGHGR